MSPPGSHKLRVLLFKERSTNSARSIWPRLEKAPRMCPTWLTRSSGGTLLKRVAAPEHQVHIYSDGPPKSACAARSITMREKKKVWLPKITTTNTNTVTVTTTG